MNEISASEEIYWRGGTSPFNSFTASSSQANKLPAISNRIPTVIFDITSNLTINVRNIVFQVHLEIVLKPWLAWGAGVVCATNDSQVLGQRACSVLTLLLSIDGLNHHLLPVADRHSADAPAVVVKKFLVVTSVHTPLTLHQHSQASVQHPRVYLYRRVLDKGNFVQRRTHLLVVK